MMAGEDPEYWEHFHYSLCGVLIGDGPCTCSVGIMLKVVRDKKILREALVRFIKESKCSGVMAPDCDYNWCFGLKAAGC